MFTRIIRPIIGSIESVDVADTKDIPAKIDTGADSSAIWASHIDMKKDGTLSFSLFDEGSPFYTGKFYETKKYSTREVSSSTGEKQIRYCVELLLRLKNRTFRTNFTLSDRSKNTFPILIGRHTLSKRFLVDVSKESIKRPKMKRPKNNLKEELKANPYKFHHKYIKKSEKKK